MTIIRCQVNLQSDSLVAEDTIVNVWHGITVGETSALTAATTFTGWLLTFYAAIDNQLSSTLSNTPHVVKVYDLEDPEPRAPVLETNWTTLSMGATTLPRETAICLSFQGVRLSGVPQARRRGRVFLGPWYASAADTSTGRPQASTITAIQGAAAALLSSSDASSEVKWCVYSPTTQEAVVVANGWIDNEWDTQRRRGFQPSSRVVF